MLTGFQALKSVSSAMNIFDRKGERLGKAVALAIMSEIYLIQGSAFSECLQLCEQCHAIAVSIGEKALECTALCTLGR